MEERVIWVVGVSPILMHNPAGMVRQSTSVGVKKIPTPEEECAKAVYQFKDSGQLYVPSDWFRQSGLGACRGRRIGKTGAAAKFQAGIFLTAVECPLVDPLTREPISEYEIDVRRTVVQRQGVMRARPRVDRWATEVVFEHDPELITTDQFMDLMTMAGKVSGVGDYRVGRGGPMGRFMVQLLS